MKLKAKFEKKTYTFKRPSGTSRGILTEKHAWLISIFYENTPNITGIGECSIIPGLSPDFIDFETYTEKIIEVTHQINFFAHNLVELKTFPSIYFGVEMALLDLKNGGRQSYFKNDFLKGIRKIPINGLIWMGEYSFMEEQINNKIEAGFSCIKLKIGALDFQKELKLIEQIRAKYSENKITIRVDANGAFSRDEAFQKLENLAAFDIHSIEQPIRQGQTEEMRKLCDHTPLPIALDEELIGIYEKEDKQKLLQQIKPQYIILKPSLLGGFTGTREWIELAEQENIPWWITSALESNIGLNAIAQFTAEYSNELPQGLGTGALYLNNEPSSLKIEQGYLFWST